MNIAEITTYKEGGAYTHVVELIKKINAHFLVITGNTRKSGYQTENGVHYYHVPMLFTIWTIFFVGLPGSYNKVRNLLKKHNIDLAHFHSPLFSFLIGLLKKKEIPLVMTTHYLLEIKANRLAAFFYQGFIRWMTCSIAENVDKIICVNKEYISIFTSWGIEKEKLLFIPNGVNTKKFSPGSSSRKKKFKNDKLIVYFGRLHYQKNVDLLIRSYVHIAKVVPNAKLIIIGDGPDFQKLKRMSVNNKENIIMTGYLPKNEDLVDFLRAADIAVFPSRGENASFTIMEAMACELPVISSDVGNAKEILGDERGIVLKHYTEEEVAKQCIHLLTHEKEAKKMGVDGRKYVEQHHSWEKISKKTEQLYTTIISESTT
jgi:glycosyltransferase involved in cell wall biosynthesis